MPTELKKDVYGRDEAERTVELNSHIAEAVSKWVDGDVDETAFASIKAEHEGSSEADTFDESLGYIVYRGLAEIKRAIGAKELRKREKKAKQNQERFADMLRLNPALVADPTFVANMLRELEIVKNVPQTVQATTGVVAGQSSQQAATKAA